MTTPITQNTENTKGLKMTIQAQPAQIFTASDDSLHLHIPIQCVYARRRRHITLPNGQPLQDHASLHTLTPLQQALARGFEWLSLLESKQYASIKDIALSEKVDNSYVSRLINLTLLAPDIIDHILNDTLNPAVSLFDLAVEPPRCWLAQREKWVIPFQSSSR